MVWACAIITQGFRAGMPQKQCAGVVAHGGKFTGIGDGKFKVLGGKAVGGFGKRCAVGRYESPAVCKGCPCYGSGFLIR